MSGVEMEEKTSLFKLITFMIEINHKRIELGSYTSKAVLVLWSFSIVRTLFLNRWSPSWLVGIGW